MMEVLNLATCAFFEALKNNNLDESLLVHGTGLSVAELKASSKKHHWSQFVQMYQNLEKHLGREFAAREIAYTGLNNNNMSFIKKIGSGLISVKNGYWFTCVFVARYLYGKAVHFEYKSLNSKQIVITISLEQSLKECPIFLETYHYLFEITPTLIGLPKAKVSSSIDGKMGKYYITFPEVNIVFQFFKVLRRIIEGHRNSIELLSEIEQKKQELEKLTEEKTQLLRILSHDIANSSCVIDLSLKMLEKRMDNDDPRKDLLSKAQNSSLKLTQVLRGVKLLERSDLGHVDFEAVDVSSLLDRLVLSTKILASKKDLEIDYINEVPENIFIRADANALEVSVLGNLISNAIKFSYPGNKITITGQLLDSMLVFKIADHGIGMSNEMKNNLFNRKFHQSVRGTSGEDGTGLGMGIVKAFIDVFEGKIEVFDNYPSGTVFILTFPQLENQKIENELQV